MNGGMFGKSKRTKINELETKINSLDSETDTLQDKNNKLIAKKQNITKLTIEIITLWGNQTEMLSSCGNTDLIQKINNIRIIKLIYLM